MIYKAVIYADTRGTAFHNADIPPQLEEEAALARMEMLEMLADHDDEMMEMYLEGQEIPVELVKKVIRKATISLEIVPVMCGSAFKNKGVQPLLDAVVEYLPSPLDMPNVIGVDPDDTSKEIEIKADASEPFAALAFKIMVDPFVGRLAFCRIYSATIENGMSIYNTNTRRR